MADVTSNLGERRHETCRFGMLTQAFIVPVEGGRHTPTVIPLCTWRPEPCPPALTRQWGGAVELDQDCAVCSVHDPLLYPPASAEDRGGAT